MINETSNNSELEKGLENREKEGKPVKKRGVNNNVLFCTMYIFALIPIYSFSNIAASLIIWLLKKNKSEVINLHGKNVLNFQITGLIAVASFSLSFPNRNVTTFCYYYYIIRLDGVGCFCRKYSSFSCRRS